MRGYSTSMEVGIAVCAIALAIWGWTVLNWVWLRPKRLEKWLRQQGLKGNSYRLLYGDMKEMAAMSKAAKSKPIGLSQDIIPRILPLQHKYIQNYGKNSFVWVGVTPMVLIRDPEIVGRTMSENYEFHRLKESNKPFRLLSAGVLSLEGEKWAKHRKIVNPAFHLEKLKNMVPAFHLSCSEMVKKWEEMVPSADEGGMGFELDVWPYLQNLSSDVISRTAFGSNYEEGRKIFGLLRDLAVHGVQLAQSVYIPGSRFLPTKTHRQMEAIDRQVKSSLRVIIDKRKKAIEGGKESSNGELLSILLESNLNEIKLHGNKNVGMSIEDVIGECKLFYFAGQETTSALIVWTMVLLSRHPTWQTRAREEVEQVFGSKSTMDYDALNKLKIVNMILLEALRLYPPVPVIGRVTTRESRAGDISLPAGVRVLLPTVMIQRDPAFWGDDAAEFKPERFADGVSKATKGRVCFYPFGWGPRLCVGQTFALLEAKMALSMILQRFSFQLSPSYVHAPHIVITLQPQHGVHLLLHKL